jgi:hypothetical protein
MIGYTDGPKWYERKIALKPLFVILVIE